MDDIWLTIVKIDVNETNFLELLLEVIIFVVEGVMSSELLQVIKLFFRAGNDGDFAIGVGKRNLCCNLWQRFQVGMLIGI